MVRGFARRNDANAISVHFKVHQQKNPRTSAGTQHDRAFGVKAIRLDLKSVPCSGAESVSLDVGIPLRSPAPRAIEYDGKCDGKCDGGEKPPAKPSAREGT